MVLVNGDNFHELWELSLPASGPQSWKRVSVQGTHFPRASGGFSAVYDSVRDRIIVFGGQFYLNPNNEVWALSMGDAPEWTSIATQGAPPTLRSGQSAIFDPVRDRMVLFSGAVNVDYQDQQYFPDTWALEFRENPTWVPLSTKGPGPIAREGATAVYDPWGDRMIIFGGWNGSLPWQVSPIFNDTWALSLTGEPAWHRLDVAEAPPARHQHVAVLDPVGQRMIISAGNSWQWRNDLTDTWALPIGPAEGSIRTWTRLAANGASPAVYGHSAIYSPERRSLLQFGGVAYANECYELALPTLTWSQLNANAPSVFPSRRAVPTLVVDRNSNQLLMFGGGPYGCQHDLWAFGLRGNRLWNPMATIGISPVCGDPNFVFDPVRNRLLSFGCVWKSRSPCELEVWALPLAEPREWTQIAVTGPVPQGREEFSLVYDPIRDRVLLFGGTSYYRRGADWPEDRNELWSFSLAEDKWAQLDAANPPHARRRHWAGYDAARDRMLVVGGSVSGYRAWFSIHDCWALPLGADSLRWSSLGPDAPGLGSDYEGPPMQAAVDALRDRLLVWDGVTASSLELAQPTAWTSLLVGGELPTPREQYGITYDSIGDQMLIYAGYDGSMKGDLQALRFSQQVGVELLSESRERGVGGPHGPVRIAVLAGSDFSPDSVLVETVTLAGVHSLDRGHEREHQGPKGERREDRGPSWRDVNNDARMDLVLRFAADSLRLALDDSVAILRARTTHFEILGRVRAQSPHRGMVDAEVQLDAEGQAGVRLGVRSPALSTFAITYQLQSAGPARLEVFDLAGRRVLDRMLEGEAPGEHRIILSDRSLNAGVYLIRLEQHASVVFARAVLLR